MLELNRRHLLLGGAASLAGAATIPLLQARPALASDVKWRQVHFEGLPGGDALTTVSAGPFGLYGATYTSGGDIVAQARMDTPSQGVKYWTNIPHHGRVTPQQPIDPRTGIFSQPDSYEHYRIHVAGFGVVVYDAAAQRIRYQVIGANGQRHWGDLRRYDNPSNLQALVNTFVDQANTLNQQYQTFWNQARQYGLGFAPAVTAGITGLIVTGANPLTIVGLIAAAVTGGITLVGNLANAQNAYLTTMNQMIETFERMTVAFGLEPVNIARYNVGGVRWNRAWVEYVDRPTYAVISVPNP